MIGAREKPQGRPLRGCQVGSCVTPARCPPEIDKQFGDFIRAGKFVLHAEQIAFRNHIDKMFLARLVSKRNQMCRR